MKYQGLRTGTGAETKLETIPGRKIIVGLKVNSIRGLNKNEEQNIQSNNVKKVTCTGRPNCRQKTGMRNFTARRGVLGKRSHFGPRLYPVCNARNGLMVQGMERGDVFRRHNI